MPVSLPRPCPIQTSTEVHWQQCTHLYLLHARSLHPDAIVTLNEHQGACSVTLLVTTPKPTTHNADSNPGHYDHPDNLNRHGPSNLIIQFRPHHFALDIKHAQTAHTIHCPLAPRTLVHASLKIDALPSPLQVVEMSCLPGTPFSAFQPRSKSLDPRSLHRLETLLSDLTLVFARSWHASSSLPADKRPQLCTGRVGSSISARLCRLAADLPTDALRACARRVRTAVERGALSDLPLVLTHGDLLPANMLVSPSWRLTGLIDWAEAEYLPFGIGLVGVEHMLGYIDHGIHVEGGRRTPRFVYYAQAASLRDGFWRALVGLVPALLDERVASAVCIARDVGVLLWRGFAWDDGRIDRVVNPSDDEEELSFLCAFLNVEPSTLIKLKL